LQQPGPPRKPDERPGREPGRGGCGPGRRYHALRHRQAAKPPAGTRIGDAKPALHATADWDRIEALCGYAAERGVALLDVAIGGLAAQPAVASVIAGATSPEQVAANAAAGRWEPGGEDLAALAAL